MLAKILEYLQPILLAAIAGLLTAIGLAIRNALRRLPRAMLALAVRWRDNAAQTASKVDDVTASVVVAIVESFANAFEETFGERKTDAPPPAPAAKVTLPTGETIPDRRANSRPAQDVAGEKQVGLGKPTHASWQVPPK